LGAVRAAPVTLEVLLRAREAVISGTTSGSASSPLPGNGGILGWGLLLLSQGDGHGVETERER